MFNPDFYPTPDNVISKMLTFIPVEGKVILEPSAGKGNIVDHLTTAKEVLACEKEPELRKILNHKCKVIGSDFLAVKAEAVSHIDSIIMNPPFSRDEQHILHAWEIAPEGCEIVALCNYNTVKNTYTRDRKRLSTTIHNYGNWEKLGEVFGNSERSTSVDIALVYLKKPGEKSGEFEGFFMDEDPEEQQVNGIMPYNFIRDLVNRYVEAVRLFDKQLQLGVQMNTLTSGFYRSKFAFHCTEDDKVRTRNDFKKDLQKEAWTFIFRKMNMDKYITKGLKADINNFVETQEKVPFTMRNIYRMLEMIVGTHEQRMDKAIEDVFTRLTDHHHDNRHNVEGWKTNSHYLINRKFIIPYMARIGWSGEMQLEYGSHNSELIEDMNKALCWLTGTNYESIDTLHRFLSNNAYKGENKHFEFATWYEWGFFEFKGFKKGTMHFKFKDERVWGLFNQRVAKILGYPLYERKAA